MKEHFKTKKNNVYYRDTQLKGITAEGFSVLYKFYYDRCFLRDAQGIWWFSDTGSKPAIKFVSDDLARFEVVDESFAKDSASVFHTHRSCIAIPNSNPATFQLLVDTSFAKDKNQAYASSSGFREGLMVLDNVDVDSFVACDEHHYATDKDKLYHYYHHVLNYHDGKYMHSLSRGEEPSAKPSDQLIQNQNYLYRKYPDIKGWWHPEYDFTSTPPTSDKEGYVVEDGVYYLEDSNLHLSFCTPTLIRDADKTSFIALDRWHGKDSAQAYYQWRSISGTELDSFEALDNHLARDAKRYYYRGYPILNADYNSFEPIIELCDKYVGFMAKDKDRLFSSRHRRIDKFKGYDWFLDAINGSDVDSFKVYCESWSKDKNQVYRYGNVVRKIDAASFEYLHSTDENNHWAKDKNHLYNSNAMRTVKGIEGGSFKRLNNHWGKDKHHVFSFTDEKIIRAIDVGSFKVIDDSGAAEDNQYLYWFDHDIGYPELKKKQR